MCRYVLYQVHVLLYRCSEYLCIRYFVFFKQKTAYEMRISDWSSDVCSSDLRRNDARPVAGASYARGLRYRPPLRGGGRGATGSGNAEGSEKREIGRASCRERVCQYV